MSSKNIFIYMVGTAGSGKSSMTKAFKQWMNQKGLDVVTVNLDPGAENVNYMPDVDIREWIDLNQIMEEFGLGPNGAQVACADMLALKAKDLAEVLEGFETNYYLMDTPGQLELFSFRKSSNVIVDALGRDRSVIAFTYDPLVAKTPEGLISQIMLRATVQFRFLVPTVSVLTKVDLLNEEELETITRRAGSVDALEAALTEGVIGSQTQINLELLRALDTVGAMSELVKVTSKEGIGFGDLYNIVQQVFEGGEDLTPD
jgi:GTPase SAR1 family protein